jgi:aspartate dehydrogenase
VRRVGLIGHGAIGTVVAAELLSGRVAGSTLSAVLTRSGTAPRRVDTVEGLIERSDVVVEAAGPHSVAKDGPSILEAGVDLLVVSVGALVDDDLRERLCDPDLPGRLLVSAGAIGCLGLLRAARIMGSLERVELTTTKLPAALLATWMSSSTVSELRAGSHPVEVFSGTAREAVTLFPESVNVAATLALATVGFEQTKVTVIGDPSADRVRHVIEVEGDAGSYRFQIENTPSANPRTSAITPYNVVRALCDMGDALVVGL